LEEAELLGRVEKELALTPCRWEEEEGPLFFPIYAEREAPWRREVVWGWRRSGAGGAPTLTNRALLNLKLLNPRFRERNYQRLRPYLVCPSKVYIMSHRMFDICIEY